MKGLNKIQAKLKAYSTKIDNQIDNLVKASALVARNEAIVKSPVDNGQLRQANNFRRIVRRQMQLFNNMPYAIFQEVGTGNNVNIPEDAPESIKIAAQQARAQSLGLRTNNIKANLFMYAGYKKAENYLLTELKKIGANER